MKRPYNKNRTFDDLEEYLLPPGCKFRLTFAKFRDSRWFLPLALLVASWVLSK